MCTVVCRCEPDEPVRILALRDEFVGRAFDDPGQWWPEQPGVVGGRDRAAGGTWCASDSAAGTTALLVNRIEKFDGTPSRGLLPLAALRAGERWTDEVDHRGMASFNLALAGPSGLTVWVWDATELTRHDLGHGTHLITSRGIDADDPKTERFAPQFHDRAAGTPWLGVVTACEPSADDSALVVRRELPDDRTYATVFGQLITSAPDALTIDYTRTPWEAGTWTNTWTSAATPTR